MITQKQYFGIKPHTPQQDVAATRLLTRANLLLGEYRSVKGSGPDIDPDTGTEISGAKNGAGDGGFRLQTATTGKTKSRHKILPAAAPEGAAVDASDQDNGLDKWLDEFEDGQGGNSKLEQYGLYREHPDSTPTWCHLQDVAPASGKRTFLPG